MVQQEELINIARTYAFKCHKRVNHWYDGRRYDYHLEMAYQEALKYINLVPEEVKIYVLAAVLCHDVFEDCRESYNDIKRNVGEIVADIVYAVSNEKGKNREEKQNEKYYIGIRSTPGALFVKLCDRLVNTKYSLKHKSSMFNKYKKEYTHFRNQLYNENCKPMFDELDNLCK